MIPHLWRAALLSLLIPTVAACGGKSSSAPSGGEAGRDSAGGSMSTGGSASTGGSMTTGGSTPTGGSAACTQHDDESPVSVDVILINKTSKTLYLGQDTVTCGVAPLFTVTDARGAALPGVSDCRASCSEIRKPNGAGGCPAICRFPSSIKLAPGDSYATIWDALYSVPAALPGSCVPFDPNASSVMCDQAKRIVAGTYTFSARAGSAIDCSMTTAAAECQACMPDGNGGCTIQGALIGGAMLKTDTTATFDASYGFSDAGVGAAPNADDTSSAPGALPTATVELIFTE